LHAGSSLARPDQFLPRMPWRVMRFVWVGSIVFVDGVDGERGDGGKEGRRVGEVGVRKVCL
jgi:hypothetical protein